MKISRAATAEGQTGANGKSEAIRAHSVTGNGSIESNSSCNSYRIAPFSRLQHQAVDWLSLMHRKHTAHILLEVDVEGARAALCAHRAGTGENISLAALVTACVAKAAAENRHMHAYRKGRNSLVLFDEVDVAVITAQEDAAAPGLDSHQRSGRTPHIIRAANTKSAGQIDAELRAAKAERSPITVWLPFWLLLPSPIRTLGWMGLLNNPHVRKRIMGTVAVSVVDVAGQGASELSAGKSSSNSGIGPFWKIPLVAHTLAVELGGISRKPVAIAPQTGSRGAGERIEVHEHLSITISVDDDIITAAQAEWFAGRLKELIENHRDFSVAVAGESRTPAQAENTGQHVARRPDHMSGAITAIKGIHTAIFVGMGSCLGYIVYSGFVGRITRPAKLAMLTLGCEGMIFARNGFRCPLADMAEDLGSDSGTVGDIFLPRWFADRIPVISSALLCASGVAYLTRRRIDAARKPHSP